MCARLSVAVWPSSDDTMIMMAGGDVTVGGPPPGAATITIYRVCMCSGRRRRSHEPEMTADRAVERLGLRAGETVARFGTR